MFIRDATLRLSRQRITRRNHVAAFIDCFLQEVAALPFMDSLARAALWQFGSCVARMED